MSATPTASCNLIDSRAFGFGRRAATVFAISAALLMGTISSPGFAQVSVDQMSCSAAVQAAQRTGSYSKRTGFGVVPIRPSYPISRTGAASCPPRFDLSFFIERTLDNPACVLGYSCVERVRLRNQRDDPAADGGVFRRLRLPPGSGGWRVLEV
jgi:hypothetical protein